MKQLTKHIVKNLIQPRSKTSNKGDHGHALIIAGNIGKMGAAVIAGKACLRSGCGLLTICVKNSEATILQTTIPEAMLEFGGDGHCNFDHFAALGIGPGIGVSKESTQLLLTILREFKMPLVLDADAINIIAADKKVLNLIPPKSILTPHSKEYDRLFGIHSTPALRIHDAIEKAKKYDMILVLKGHQTLITNGKNSFLNTTGNAGLAKGGSGDALTGMITSFLAQGYEPFQAAKLGVYLHGLAADIALEEQSVESMLITDVIECIGRAFKKIR